METTAMKIAGVQMDIRLGDVEGNLNRMREKLAETRANGAELTVFPECAATGYCFDNLEETRPHAQAIPGPAIEFMIDACKEFGGYVVFGLLETDGGSAIYNAAALVGPDGLIGSYRKVHLPFLGIDQKTTPGDRPFAVFEAGEAKVGLNICYDAAFPESSRCLTLAGAELIILPTNWPEGAQTKAQHAINTRAMENSVYYIAVNRVGEERGWNFIGMSSICDPGGNTLDSAMHDDEAILYAEIDLERARKKTVERGPGVTALHRLADRRPEMYGPLTKSHGLQKPGRKD